VLARSRLSEALGIFVHMFEGDTGEGAGHSRVPGGAAGPGPAGSRPRDPSARSGARAFRQLPDSAALPGEFAPPADVSAIPASTGRTPGIHTLSELVSLDPAALGPQEAVNFLKDLERHLGWLHSIQAVALVAAAGPEPVITEVEYAEAARRGADPGIDDVAREEVASATGWGSGHARRRIGVARLLTGYLPQTMRALRIGQISHAHACAIADAAEQLPGFGDPEQRDEFAEACALLEGRVLPAAVTSSVTRCRRAAARAAACIADLDPSHRRRNQRLAHQVTLIDDADGSSTLIARMPAHHAHACMAAVQHLANHPLLDLPCDATIGQRRALAMATLIIGPRPSLPDSTAIAGSPSPNQPEGLPAWPDASLIAPRPAVHLDLVVTLEALLGLTDQHAAIPGAGHLPADVVRSLLGDATMRRMITDPITGHLLELGRRTYRVPDALRRFIEARDQTCRFPGCSRRAIHCEIDHAIPWSEGGETSPGNLGALCTRHHRMKTHAGWSIQDADASGACRWKSPHGHVYEHEPPPPLDPPIARRPSSPSSEKSPATASVLPTESNPPTQSNLPTESVLPTQSNPPTESVLPTEPDSTTETDFPF